MARKKWFPVLFVLALLTGCQAISAGGSTGPKIDASKVGVVLLHGKGVNIFYTISEAAGVLRAEGYWVLTPEMPWSVDRGYDASYQDAMKETDKAVSRLRKGGTRYIFVGGHSMGANGALGYAATFGNIDGVMALAPGHVPDLPGFYSRLSGSLSEARRMIRDGKGDARVDFSDVNQGEVRSISTTSRIYMSYFDPDGPAVIPNNVIRLKKGIPLLWLVGRSDRMFRRGEGYAYMFVPEHPLNRYVVVDGSHNDTPSGSDTGLIVEWMKKVVSSKP
jgi:pimeloyl-ACP methyl ester carboxylesterase